METPMSRVLSKLGLGRQPSVLAKTVRAENLTYLSDRKMIQLERILDELKRQSVPGSYVEFGVALGGSAIIIAKVAAARGSVFHGYDVFGMIPEPTSDKDDAHSKDRYQTIVSGASEGIGDDTYYGYLDDLYERVCDTMTRHGCAPVAGRIELHKGLFEDTVPGVDMGQIAFAHIDCDWYDPVVYCLDIASKKLAPGGAILLDDYHDYGGCKTATDEFLAAHPEFDLKPGRNPYLVRR
ncbi:MAG: TylF/MycF/NovP-related O-methyltransferase [Pseudomonadota bacterium]